MSTIPNAKRSSIIDLTVTPDSKWERYPTVDRSALKSCTYINLNKETKIERSHLDSCNIASDKVEGKSRIERSNIRGSHISDSFIERSNLVECTVIDTARFERSGATDTRCFRADKVERSVLKKSVISDKSRVERSNLIQSIVADSSKVVRSRAVDSSVVKSNIERAFITDCEITECRIERTNFNGMILKYGIWKNGDLVGRTCDKEVEIRPKTDETQQKEGAGSADHQSSVSIDRKLELPQTHPPSTEPQIGQTLHIQILQHPEPSKCAEDPLPSGSESTTEPASYAYSNATGLTDEDREFPYDTYEGPNIDSPPPYEP